MEYLGIFVKAGATFKDADDIIFRALKDPCRYSEGRDDDGSTTGEVLRTLLERGASTNSIRRKGMPLQVAARQLKYFWVQESLYNRADLNMVVDQVGSGEDSDDPGSHEKRYHKTLGDICRTTKQN